MIIRSRNSFCVIIFLAFAIAFSLISNELKSQNKGIDSLLNLIDWKNDSSKVVALKLLCWEYRNKDTVLALKYGYEAEQLAEQLNLQYQLSDIYGRIGIVKRNQGKYSDALDLFFKGLKISQDSCYAQLNAFAYNNIGDIYNRLGIYNRALEYVNKGLEIALKGNDKTTSNYIYNVKGLIYTNLNMHDSALKCFNQSLKIRKELNFTIGIATSYINIGSIYCSLNELDSCFYYTQKAIEIFSSNNDRTGLIGSFKLMGDYYNKAKDYDNAIQYFNKSLELNKNFGDLSIQKDVYEGLKLSYQQLGNINMAFYYQELSVKINDSLSTNVFVERITHLTESLKYELQRQESELIQKQKERELSSKIKFQQSLIRLYISILILIVLLVITVVYFYFQKYKSYKLLNLQKRQIEELNSTKDKLFSIIGHDLKNPIASIIGVAEVLNDTTITIPDDKRKQLIRSICDVGISTHHTLEGLLNWAKTQTNSVNVRYDNINLNSLIDSIIRIQTPIASQKGITIENIVEKDLSAVTDTNIISTILRNLTLNAIKYSKQGGRIIISAENQNQWVVVSVKDFGVGMNYDVKNALFSSTNIKSSYGTANEKGTGLGLIICKEFIAKLGGKIWVESEIDHGSTFHFTIPKKSI